MSHICSHDHRTLICADARDRDAPEIALDDEILSRRARMNAALATDPMSEED